MRNVAWRLAIWLALLAACCSPGLGKAQSFPARPLRLIIGFAPGGITDVLNRMVAEKMGAHLGQPVVVENRPGANSLLAAQAVRNAAPDGYTLFGGVSTVFAPVFMKSGFSAATELAPVAATVTGDWYMYVTSSLGVGSIKELVAWAKSNPGKLRFAAPATSNHMLMAVFSKRLGMEFENIPYKATDQTILSLLAGDTQVTFNAAAGFEPYLQNGKLRAIATLAPARTALMPDVPTAAEQGVPLVLRFNHGIWTALKVPRDVIARLGEGVNAALQDPQLQEAARKASLAVVSMTPEEMVRTYEGQIQFFTEAAALINFKPE
jgi:tripartite-type tricarboxylate transporter receptor subunit TctC